MALNFPDTPSNGQVYLGENGIQYTYNLTNDSWTGKLQSSNVPIDPSPADVSVTPAFGNPSGTNPGSGTLSDPFIITNSVVPTLGGSTESLQTITITNGKAGDQVIFTNNTTPTTIAPKYAQAVGVIDGNGKWTGKLTYNDSLGAETIANITYTGNLQVGNTTVYFRWVVQQQATPPMIVTVGSALTGQALIGTELGATQPTVTGGILPYTYSYRWQTSDNGADFTGILNATSNVYTLVVSDIGKYIRCAATVSDSSAIQVVSITSNTAIVNAMSIDVSLSTTTPKAGDTITATAVTAGGVAPVTTAYQWKADDVNIAGATSTTYTVVEADKDKRLSCLVTTTDTSGTSVSKSSDPTDPVFSGTAPEINTVTLTEVTPDSPDRYTDQAFTVAVDMTSNTPKSDFSLRGKVLGDLTTEVATSVITKLEEEAVAGNWVGYVVPANGWRDITYGNGKYVAIADGGTASNQVMYSSDGINWTLATSASVSSWASVTFGAGKFVALGATNIAMYSTDGINWTSGSGYVGSGTSVVYGLADDRFVATSGTSGLAYSYDGIAWNNVSDSSQSQWRGITYGNGTFVAITESGQYQAAYSTDGANWTFVDSAPTNNWYNVAYGDGRFVAVSNGDSTGGGASMYSTDNGATWTQVTTVNDTYAWYALAYGDGKFVAGAGNADVSNNSMWSVDGTTWNGNTSSAQFFNMTYGDGQFVSVTFSSVTNQVNISADGTGVAGTSGVLTLTDTTGLSSINQGDTVVQNSGGTPITTAITNVTSTLLNYSEYAQVDFTQAEAIILFNGDITDNTGAPSLDTGYKKVLNLAQALNIRPTTKISGYFAGEDRDVTLRVAWDNGNSNTYTATIPSSIGWVDFNVSARAGQLVTTIEMKVSTGASNLWGVGVDGNLLEDTVLSNLTLTDDTNLANFRVGDVVQGNLEYKKGLASTINIAGVRYSGTNITPAQYKEVLDILGKQSPDVLDGTFGSSTFPANNIYFKSGSYPADETFELEFLQTGTYKMYFMGVSNNEGSVVNLTYTGGATGPATVSTPAIPSGFTLGSITVSSVPATILIDNGGLIAWESPSGEVTTKITAINEATPSITTNGGSWSGTDGTGDPDGWNQSQVWSTNLSGALYPTGHASAPAAAFDGNLATGCKTSNQSTPVVYNASLTNVTSLSLQVRGSGFNTTNTTFVISGNGIQTLSTTIGTSLVPLTVTNSTVSDISVTSTAGSTSAGIAGIVVNGKLLVDTGISGTPPTPATFVTGPTQVAATGTVKTSGSREVTAAIQTSVITNVDNNTGEWTEVIPSGFQAGNYYCGANDGAGTMVFGIGGGTGRKIFTSTDNGVTFNSAGGGPSGTTQLYGMAYGNGRFVAAGDQGYYSDNGTSWTAISMIMSGDGSQVQCIGYGAGKFIAGGSSYYKMASSTDGITWSQYTATGITSIQGSIQGIAYGNGVWVCVGLYGIAYSTNGTSWTNISYSSDTFNAIIYAGGYFAIVGRNNSTQQGKVIYSTNGTSWSTATGINMDYSFQIAYGDGTWLITPVSGGPVNSLQTQDISNWSSGEEYTQIPLRSCRALQFGNGVFAGGDEGSSGKIYTNTSAGYARTILNLTDTTDLARFTPGDVVQPADGITVYANAPRTDTVPNTKTGIKYRMSITDLPSGSSQYTISQLFGGFPSELTSTGNVETWASATLTSGMSTVGTWGLSETKTADEWRAQFISGSYAYAYVSLAAYTTSLANGTDMGEVGLSTIVTSTNLATPSITTDGGSWSGTDGTSSGDVADRETKVTGPVETTEVVGPYLTLSSSSGRWLVTESDYNSALKLNRFVKASSRQSVASLFTVMDNSGNISDLSVEDPGYTTMIGDPTYTTTFPSVFPSGLTPDLELPPGTKYQVEVVATNTLGNDNAFSNDVMPVAGLLQTSVITANASVFSSTDWFTTATKVNDTGDANNTWDKVFNGTVTSLADGVYGTGQNTPTVKFTLNPSFSPATYVFDVYFGGGDFVGALGLLFINGVMIAADDSRWSAVTASTYQTFTYTGILESIWLGNGSMYLNRVSANGAYLIQGQNPNLSSTILTTTDNTNYNLFSAGDAVVESSGGTPVTSAITNVGEVAPTITNTSQIASAISGILVQTGGSTIYNGAKTPAGLLGLNDYPDLWTPVNPNPNKNGSNETAAIEMVAAEPLSITCIGSAPFKLLTVSNLAGGGSYTYTITGDVTVTGTTGGSQGRYTALSDEVTITPNTSGATFTFTANNGMYINYVPLGGATTLTFTNDTNLANFRVGDTVNGSGFNSVIYTGNGGTQDISCGFSADFVWIKSRSDSVSHSLYDIIRGVGNRLKSDSSEGNNFDATGLTAFNNNGFTINGSIATNESSKDYVAWCWDAGNTTVTNNDGSVASQVRSNGNFSIVSWTNGVFSPLVPQSVGHGLNSVPKLWIYKDIDSSDAWYVYHEALDFSDGQYLSLNTDGAMASGGSSIWGADPATTTTMPIGTTFNGTGNYIGYAWADVPGVNSIGSYTGNGTDPGPVVNCGFEPEWLLVKCTTITSYATGWNIVDSARGTSQQLYPNYTNAEGSYPGYVEFTSTGFKVTNTSYDWNNLGDTYIYMAFSSGSTITNINEAANQMAVDKGSFTSDPSNWNQASVWSGMMTTSTTNSGSYGSPPSSFVPAFDGVTSNGVNWGGENSRFIFTYALSGTHTVQVSTGGSGERVFVTDSAGTRSIGTAVSSVTGLIKIEIATATDNDVLNSVELVSISIDGEELVDTGISGPASVVTGPTFPPATGTISAVDSTNSKLTFSETTGRWLVTQSDYDAAKKLDTKVAIPLVLDASNSAHVALFNALNTSLTAYPTDKQAFVDALRTKVSGLSLTTPELQVLCTVSHTLIKRFVVTVAAYSGSNYFYIDGVRQATLALKKGTTYIFDQDEATNAGHPLKIYTDANKTTEYTSGVTIVGTPGSALSRTAFLVPTNAPATLYYQCSNHAGMGGQLNIS
jgi:hypothetical protein